MNFDALAAFTIHDVKNRLTVLASRAEEKGDRETLQSVLESAEALTRLLTLYRAENGTLDVTMDARVPADVLNELAVEVGGRNQATLTVDLSAAPPLWFYDEELIRMVLLNAVYNAIRHGQSRVVLKAAEQGAWLVFSVSDDGPGFPDEVLAHPDAPHPVNRQGTGLGLHLASRVAALHRNAGLEGYIQLANEGGAVFRVFIPH